MLFIVYFLYRDYSIKSTKLYFQSWKNFFQRFCSFSVKWLNDCGGIKKQLCQTAWGLKIPFIYFRHLKVSWVKAYQISCLFIFTSVYLLMQVSISSKTIPPGDDLKGAKTLPPGQSLCTKTLPSGQNRESKAPPSGHKVRKFHECI